MKSPAIEEGMRPLRVIDDAALETFGNAHREWEAAFEVARAKYEGAKDRARRAASKGDEIDQRALIKPTVPEEPRLSRLIINDATVPALVELLRENPDGVLVFRDELAGLIAQLDREGMEGSRTFFMSGWTGKEGYTQDRIIRGTNLRVPHVCLSMLGGIQPARVAPLLRDCLATGGGDGFLSRFSLAVWPDSPGEYRAIDRGPNQEARRQAHAVYQRLRSLSPEAVGAVFEEGSAPFLRLDAGAFETFMTWDVQLRNHLRFDAEDSALAAHLGKYPKMVCALALLCHLADGLTGPVTNRAVERALAWAKLLESHARRIYASLAHANIVAARALRRRLQRGDLSSPFTVREVYRKGWAHLADREAAQAAADVLEARNWLRSEMLETGGRRTVVYHAHPGVLPRLDS
jgi:putative DNA primase/helicase